MAYLTIDKFGVVQLWNHKPEYNKKMKCWQAWIKKGYFNEVAIDITANDYFRNNITFEESPKEIKI